MKPLYWIGYQTVNLLTGKLLRATVKGKENIPPGGCLVISNHVSFLDPTTVGWALEREIHYLARKTLFKPPLGWLFCRVNVIPVDQERPDMTSLRKVIKLLKQGEMVLLFPEGARSADGTIQQGQPGAGLVACKAGVPILPVRLFGTYEALPRGASKLRLHGSRIVIGKPFEIPPEEREGKTSYRAAADRMMKAIAELTID